MTPGLRGLLETPDRIDSIPTNEIPAVLGELMVLVARLVQISTTPDTAQTQKLEDLDRLLTVRETATILNLRPTHVYDLVRQGTLPALRVGKLVRLRLRDLQKWIDSHHEEPMDGKIRTSLSSHLAMNRPSMKGQAKKSRR